MIRENEPRPDFVETEGLKGEKIVEEFLKEAFPDFIEIQESKTFDPNDINGIDFVCTVKDGEKEHKFAVDMTFASDPRRDFKMKKTFRQPLATVRDEQGAPIGEPIPRVLLYERSTSMWFLNAQKAQEAGVPITEVMPEDEKLSQEIRFLQTVVDQAENLGKLNKDYAHRIKPVKDLFEKKIKELEAAA